MSLKEQSNSYCISEQLVLVPKVEVEVEVEEENCCLLLLCKQSLNNEIIPTFNNNNNISYDNCDLYDSSTYLVQCYHCKTSHLKCVKLINPRNHKVKNTHLEIIPTIHYSNEIKNINLKINPRIDPGMDHTDQIKECPDKPDDYQYYHKTNLIYNQLPDSVLLTHPHTHNNIHDYVGIRIHGTDMSSYSSPMKTKHYVGSSNTHHQINSLRAYKKTPGNVGDFYHSVDTGSCHTRGKSGGNIGSCTNVWTTILLVFVLTIILITDLQRFAFKHQQEVAVSSQLRVEVYYEALCPDSRHFIMKQLMPAYEKLSSIISLALVPYGKSKTYESDGKLTFTCQHGKRECSANKVHGCVINTVDDEAVQLKIVNCMIADNMMPMVIGQKCVEDAGENWVRIETCATTDKGDLIQKHLGVMTHSLKPSASFIPTITIDGSQDGQSLILSDFKKAICKRYKGSTRPQVC